MWHIYRPSTCTTLTTEVWPGLVRWHNKSLLKGWYQKVLCFLLAYVLWLLLAFTEIFLSLMIIPIIESYHILEKLTIVAIFSPLIIMATNQIRLPALSPLPVWFVEGSCQVVLTTKKKTIPLFNQCFHAFFYILPNFRPGTDSEFKEDTYRGSLT